MSQNTPYMDQLIIPKTLWEHEDVTPGICYLLLSEMASICRDEY